MFQGMMQGGGKAGLLGDPLFQVGMGLLAKGQDNRIPYATAVMGGLQNAQTAQDQFTQRQLLQEQARRQQLPLRRLILRDGKKSSENATTKWLNGCIRMLRVK